MFVKRKEIWMIAKCVGEMNMYLLQDLGNFLIDLKMLTIPIPGKIRVFFCLFVLPICNHLSFRSDTCFSLLLFKVATSNLGNLLFRKAVIFVCSDHSSVARYFVSVGQWIEEKCFALSSTQCYPPHVEWDLRQSLHQSTLCWKSCGFWLVSAQQWRN